MSCVGWPPSSRLAAPSTPPWRRSRAPLGVRVGKRQVEELVAAAAVDVADFYAAVQPGPSPDTDLLVLSADGKGKRERRGATAGLGVIVSTGSRGWWHLIPNHAEASPSVGMSRDVASAFLPHRVPRAQREASTAPLQRDGALAAVEELPQCAHVGSRRGTEGLVQLLGRHGVGSHSQLAE